MCPDMNQDKTGRSPRSSDELPLTEAFAAAQPEEPPASPTHHLGIELGNQEIRLRCYACDKDNCLTCTPLPLADDSIGPLRFDELLDQFLLFEKRHRDCAKAHTAALAAELERVNERLKESFDRISPKKEAP